MHRRSCTKPVMQPPAVFLRREFGAAGAMTYSFLVVVDLLQGRRFHPETSAAVQPKRWGVQSPASQPT